MVVMKQVYTLAHDPDTRFTLYKTFPISYFAAFLSRIIGTIVFPFLCLAGIIVAWVKHHIMVGGQGVKRAKLSFGFDLNLDQAY